MSSRRWRVARRRPTAMSTCCTPLAPGAHLGWAIEDLSAELADLLGRPVDLVSPRALNPRIRDQVLAEAQPFCQRRSIETVRTDFCFRAAALEVVVPDLPSHAPYLVGDHAPSGLSSVRGRHPGPYEPQALEHRNRVAGHHGDGCVTRHGSRTA